jgi:broad specificity phosphatase PhoE
MDPRQRRKRRRRAGAISAFMVFALGLAFFFESQATTTVIFVRHADAPLVVDQEVGLTPAGALRAEELARVLGDADVVQGVDAIFSSPLRVNQETAAPLARRLNLPVQEFDPKNNRALRKRILRKYKGKVVLVVAEPSLIPTVIARLQGSKKVPPMVDGEYDNIYIVSIPWYGKVKTLRLHYGARPESAKGFEQSSPSAVSAG